MEIDRQKQLIDFIREVVKTELHNLGLIQGHWRLGKVHSVIDAKMLNIYLDGATSYQKIPCNPSVTFNANDEVWVIFINGDAKNKFCISKRAV